MHFVELECLKNLCHTLDVTAIHKFFHAHLFQSMKTFFIGSPTVKMISTGDMSLIINFVD